VAELTDFAHLNHNAVCQHLGVRRAIVIWGEGIEVIIPIIWCQFLLGLFRPHEARTVT
jgi:hypothetical protein